MRNMGMGRLNNTTSLSKAANGIKDILANAQLTYEQLAQQHKILNDSTEQTLKLHMASKEVDPILSQNLGYVTSKFGQPILNENGDMTPYSIKQTEQQKAELENDQIKNLVSQGFTYEKASAAVKGRNASGGSTGISAGSTIYGTGSTDIRSMATDPRFAGIAAFKNNNTAGLTWNAGFDSGATGSAKLLKDAGIEYFK
jgi:hypothetical protein